MVTSMIQCQNLITHKISPSYMIITQSLLCIYAFIKNKATLLQPYPIHLSTSASNKKQHLFVSNKQLFVMPDYDSLRGLLLLIQDI